MLRAAALLLVFLSFQDAEVRALIEKLKSDEIVVREEAFKHLKALGEAAAPELEKAAKGADADVSRRAESLLKLLRIRRELSPNLQALIPELAERLAFRENSEWTGALLEILAWRDERWLKLRRGDLDCLVPRAWEHADPANRQTIYDAIVSQRWGCAVPSLIKTMETTLPFLRRWDLDTLDFRERAIPPFVRLLKHADPRIREMAVFRLMWAKGADAWPDVLPLLENPSSEVRVGAIRYFEDNPPRPEAVPGLLKALDRFGSLEITYAIRALAKAAPTEALPMVLKLRDHQRESVRAAVAQELREFPPQSASPAAIAMLKDPKGDVRDAALRSLLHWNLATAFDDVLPLLADSHESARDHAAEALLSFDRSRALPILRKLLSDPSEERRLTAIYSLAAAQDAPSIPEIAALLEHPKAELRIAAIGALAAMKSVAHGAAIGRRLETAAPSEARSCKDALTDLKAPNSHPVLITLLEKPEAKNLQRTIDIVASLEIAAARPALEKLLAHDKTEVRIDAARALSWIKALESIPALRQLLKDPDPEVVSRALMSLGGLEAVEAREEILPFLKKDDEDENDLVGEAIRALGALKRKDSVPDLLPFLDAYEYRVQAFHALSEINDPSAHAAMMKLFDSVDYSIRKAAIEGFGEMKAAVAVPRLVAAMKEDDEDLRLHALRSLGQIGTPDAIKALIQGLGDRKRMCRMRSMFWLREHDARTAVPAITPLLKDADSEVRLLAADTLGWLGSRDGIPAALEGGESIGLNFLRRPEACAKLKRIILKEIPEDSPEALLAGIAKAGGLVSTVKPGATPPQAQWLREKQSLSDEENLMELLYDLVDGSPYAIVIEADRILLMPREEAVALFKSWLETERR